VRTEGTSLAAKSELCQKGLRR